MALAQRVLTIRRDPHSGEVLARGGDPESRRPRAPAVRGKARTVSVLRSPPKLNGTSYSPAGVSA
ncbi:hypothetical protein AB0C82_25525, partial [Streptomyces sp. NPDC048560]